MKICLTLLILLLASFPYLASQEKKEEDIFNAASLDTDPETNQLMMRAADMILQKNYEPAVRLLQHIHGIYPKPDLLGLQISLQFSLFYALASGNISELPHLNTISSKLTFLKNFAWV